MKFNEEEDNLNYAEYQESVFKQEHDDLLTERAALVQACLRSRIGRLLLADDILDVVEEIIDFAGDILTISLRLHATAEMAQTGCGDLIDLTDEVDGASDCLLEIVQRADASSKNILNIVRELVDGRGGRRGRGGRGGGHEQG